MSTLAWWSRLLCFTALAHCVQVAADAAYTDDTVMDLHVLAAPENPTVE